MARAASSDVAPQASEGYAARARALVGSVGLGYDSVPAAVHCREAVGNEQALERTALYERPSNSCFHCFRESSNSLEAKWVKHA